MAIEAIMSREFSQKQISSAQTRRPEDDDTSSMTDSCSDCDCKSECSDIDATTLKALEFGDEKPASYLQNERRYNAYYPDAYFFPNDQRESSRLDLVHALALEVFDNELHTAPLEKPERILDLGAGSGVWIAEMAYKYPDCLVFGTDISPTAQTSFPPNCFFELQNIEQSWSFPSNYFDLIHCRNLAGGIGSWSQLFERAFYHLRPGGFLELFEVPFELYTRGPPLPADLPAVRLMSKINEALDSVGKSTPINHFQNFLRAAGFEEIHVEEREIPIGPWPGNAIENAMGRLNMLNLLEGCESWSLRLLTEKLDMPIEEVRSLVEAARRNVLDKRKKMYTKLCVFRARKPANSSGNSIP